MIKKLNHELERDGRLHRTYVMMDYRTQFKKQEWIKEEVYQIKSKMFRNDVGKYLPDQVSLLEGFMILSALNDPIMAVQHGDPIEKLKRIRSMVFLRNNSIFAHGLGPVSRQDFLRFKLFVVELFREFCKIEKVNFDQHLQDITWLNPTKSVYYSKLGV